MTARTTSVPPLWHVYTDGSSRHERRQTFSGWAARAVQPETRQVRQISGARPGGTSLEAETEALLSGLRLVPAGAAARLYSDLDLPALSSLLQTPEAEAARAHLHELWVQPIARNSNGHHHDAHRLARAAELTVREGAVPGPAGLGQAVLEGQDLARGGAADPPLSLHEPWHLPGQGRALQARIEELEVLTPGRTPERRARMAMRLDGFQGTGRTPQHAVQDAVRRGVGALARVSLVDLTVPPDWAVAAQEATQDLGTVRILIQRNDGPPEQG
ncbi:hypothetical protein [Deinococcus navajonensis]|uniref:Uncharacterized protein n=1 Tax=Deinococcus navajonensis TaxID=309884 RepID=A0ABV8XSR0_9DEIO